MDVQKLCYLMVRLLKVVIEATSYMGKTVLPIFNGAMLVVFEQLTTAQAYSMAH